MCVCVYVYSESAKSFFCLAKQAIWAMVNVSGSGGGGGGARLGNALALHAACSAAVQSNHLAVAEIFCCQHMQRFRYIHISTS